MKIVRYKRKNGKRIPELVTIEQNELMREPDTFVFIARHYHSIDEPSIPEEGYLEELHRRAYSLIDPEELKFSTCGPIAEAVNKLLQSLAFMPFIPENQQEEKAVADAITNVALIIDKLKGEDK